MSELKNMEYEDGTPSRTWYTEEDNIKLTPQQAEKVREWRRLDKLYFRLHDEQKRLEQLEKELGL